MFIQLVNINILHIDIHKWHVNIILSHMLTQLKCTVCKLHVRGRSACMTIQMTCYIMCVVQEIVAKTVK